MKIKHFKNRKGAELSINMIVVIALAVFVVFLIIGFVTGGWGYFAGIFGGMTKYGGEDAAIVKCQTALAQYKAAGSPKIGTDHWRTKLCDDRHDVDKDGDGNVGFEEITIGNEIETTYDDDDTYYCKYLLSPAEFDSSVCD